MLRANVTPQTFESTQGMAELRSGRREYEDGPRFFRHFERRVNPTDLQDRIVLDLGCGYGGRTIYYARDCAALQVTGLEVSEDKVERGRRLAEGMGCANANFVVGFAEELPFEDETFEAVVSYDVLEHVADPIRAIEEISRVLAPEGAAYLVFPSYLGARSSHLDYLTRLPALHRIFDPETIVAVVNDFLIGEPERFATSRQPSPEISVLGRCTLPTLNGLTLYEAHAIAERASLHITEEIRGPLVTENAPIRGASVAASALRLLNGWLTLSEFLTGSNALVAVKAS